MQDPPASDRRRDLVISGSALLVVGLVLLVLTAIFIASGVTMYDAVIGRPGRYVEQDVVFVLASVVAAATAVLTLGGALWVLVQAFRPPNRRWPRP